MLKSLAFYFPIGINILAVLVSFYFIITDAINHSSSDNGFLTMITLVMCAYILLAWFVHSKRPVAGKLMAWLPAIPLLLYGIFLLMFVVLKPDMR